jgi:hypothetical protein
MSPILLLLRWQITGKFSENVWEEIVPGDHKKYPSITTCLLLPAADVSLFPIAIGTDHHDSRLFLYLLLVLREREHYGQRGLLNNGHEPSLEKKNISMNRNDQQH